MRKYFITDKDGKKCGIEQDNGIVIELLEEPSPEYLANRSLPIPELVGIDLVEIVQKLKEIDDLKARIEKLEKIR